MEIEFRQGPMNGKHQVPKKIMEERITVDFA